MKEPLTVFQIIMIIFSGLTLLGGLVGLYGYMRAAIAKIDVTMLNFRRELDMERTANMQAEKFNREDHKEIMNKLNELMLK